MQTIVVIGGPTASGKSGLAMAVAHKLEGRAVIINADALQLYRDLSILSARPTPQEEADTPHRLYGVLDGASRGTVGVWLEMAHEEIKISLESGLTPILVGGSGMYIHALLNGLSRVPDIPTEVRSEVMELHAKLGGEKFHKELAAIDPVSAGKLPSSDTQRLIRFYEVAKHTGRPLHEWQQEDAQLPPATWDFRSFVLEPDRTLLYAACDLRFARMLSRGALDEVRGLLSRKLDPTLPVMKAVGVPELAGVLNHEWSLDHAIVRAQQATRNYAKRQLTWFRNQLAGASRLSLTPGQVVDNELLEGMMQLIREKRRESRLR